MIGKGKFATLIEGAVIIKYVWSIIYEANKDKIKDSNLIYPEQKLNIPRKGYTLEKIKMLRKKAGATNPYLPPKQANLPVD